MKNAIKGLRSRKKVGLIGLGIIGAGAQTNLRKSNYQVYVWSRTPRPVPNFLGSPREVAEQCEIIQLFVSDQHALENCLDAMLPALSPKHVVLNHATIGEDSTRLAEQKVASTGAGFLNAPFTGSKEAAQRGELVYYTGGSAELLKKVEPVLRATSKEIFHVGDTWIASVVKIATNMITAML